MPHQAAGACFGCTAGFLLPGMSRELPSDALCGMRARHQREPDDGEASERFRAPPLLWPEMQGGSTIFAFPGTGVRRHPGDF
jgi:hypothetical protein